MPPRFATVTGSTPHDIKYDNDKKGVYIRNQCLRYNCSKYFNKNQKVI